MMKWCNIVGLLLVMALAVAFHGCSVIDEDLSDCGDELRLDYDMHLVTNLNIELETQLDPKDDATLFKNLRDYLSAIFVDFAHDVDISLYDVQGDSTRLHHEKIIMDANQMFCTLYVPRRDYMHTAVANLEKNGVTVLEGDDYCHKAVLRQSQGETIQPHKTGIFTARELIRMIEEGNQIITVRLFMANCAAALVLDTSAASLKDLKVLSTGFASRFNVADSSYVFAANPQKIQTDKIETGKSNQQCFCTVNFPSRLADDTSADTRTIIVTTEPFDSKQAKKALWQFLVYATLQDGTVVESALSVKIPLHAGEFKIIRGEVQPDGAVMCEDASVGISVTLNWKEGNEHEIPL